MRRLLLAALAAGVLLAALSTAAVADIGPWWNYWARYQKVSGTPTWGYMPGSLYYGLPTWGYDNYWYWWHIPNYSDQTRLKTVWWEVHWMPGYQPGTPPYLNLNPAMGSVTPWEPIWNPGNYSWTWRWGITIQPGWERIWWDRYLYPQYYGWFYNLNNIYWIDVATYCYIPEPSSLAALAFGAFGAGAFIWRRRK